MVHIPLKKRKYTLQIVAWENTYGCAEALNYYFITAVSNRITIIHLQTYMVFTFVKNKYILAFSRGIFSL